MIQFNRVISFSRNSIYSIHGSYYSIDLANNLGLSIIYFYSYLYLTSFYSILYILSLFDIFSLITEFIFQSSTIGLRTSSSILIHFIPFLIVWQDPFYLNLLILFNCWCILLSWLNDLSLESFLSLNFIESIFCITGIKLLIISEFMLFFVCFWSFLNYRLISFIFGYYILPLISTFCFSIPLSNCVILLFSSIPIQSIQIFIKIGLVVLTIEGLGHSICCGLLFIILQFNEFIYSYFSISTSMIGSTFYFTTGLHGIHVILGMFGWFIITYQLTSTFFISVYRLHPYSLLMLFHVIYFQQYCCSYYRCFFNANFFIEFILSLFLCSFYWHFVDLIWLCVFLWILV